MQPGRATCLSIEARSNLVFDTDTILDTFCRGRRHRDRDGLALLLADTSKDDRQSNQVGLTPTIWRDSCEINRGVALVAVLLVLD